MQKKNYYLESVFDLNASNVWGVSAQELLDLWQKDMKDESFASSEDKILNVIRLAFEVYHFDPKDDREVMRYNNGDYVVLPGLDKRKESVAIRKKTIRQITDLSYENIKHITAVELLKLIEGNFGGGWDSISLAIKDIIESAFDISTTTLPASRIHAPGGTLERPQFKKMMADAKEKNFRAVVVYRLDRISRNIGDFAKLIEQLNRMKIDFISIKEQFDTSSPMGRAMMYISSVFSQLERETIAERIRDNMHELSKTGRWLGGNTPTGYESESVSHVTIDGKTKRACKLKILPEEIGIVKLIYDKFLETGSLTKTETYLLQNGYTTKNGKQFTRFAVKGILSNPVYLIADEFAYDYLTKNHVDLFAEQSDFDGVHGIMAYNRTLQQPGRAHQIKPMEEWIVSVGKHQGVIEGKAWVKVQTILERNKSKSYRKPRSNVALLSGLLVCGHCGEYMRPKLSQRRNAKGEPIYTYLCSMKERSRGHVCNMKNCNGNTLDADIIEQLKHLSEDGSDFIRQLEQSKRALLGNRQSYDEEISKLETEIAANEEEIKCLVSVLGKSSGTSAESYIMQQIDELHKKGEGLKRHLAELKELTSSHALADIEFDLLAQMLSTFKDTVDKMTVEQKRAAIRTFVKEIIWDGRDAHVVLFGSEYEYEFPKTPAGIGKQVAGSKTEENLEGAAEGGLAEPSGEDSK